MRAISVIILLWVLISIGCSPTSDQAIQRAAELASTSPVQAREILDSIDPGSLKNSERQLYNLLDIKTRDKLYVKHSSDTLILKVINYYSRHKETGLYPEVLYYGGRVYSDKGDYPTAIRFFQESLDMMPTDDSQLQLKGAVLSHMGRLLNAFAFDLLKAYEARFSDEEPNFIMSPQSAAWCLAMLANGASQGSESFREIADVLHLGEGATLQDVNAYTQKLTEAITAKHGNADVRVANALFYKDKIGIRDSYVNLLKSFYSADLLENPTNQIIDSWIDKKTGGQIKNFAQKNGLDQDSFGVINTLYFTGK